jgi:hypothetical protein
MTPTTNTRRTQTTRTSGPHRTKPTRRAVHRSQEQGTRNKESGEPRVAAQGAFITVNDALFAEVRDWTVLIGASLTGWLVAAIAVGAV